MVSFSSLASSSLTGFLWATASAISQVLVKPKQKEKYKTYYFEWD